MNMKIFFKRILSAVVTAAMLPIGFIFAADSGLENVALNKTVYSSGNFSNAWYDAYAVDGDLNKGYANGSIPADRPLQLSDGEKCGIMVDLEELCLVSEIDVRTRRDIDQPYSRRGWQVYVSDNIEFKNAELVGTKMLAGSFGEDLEIKFSTAKKFRYIKMVSNADIVLSEIEAWGIPLGDGTGFANYSDMEASNASYLLSYLEIIKNASLYEPLKLVTRKEAAEYIMKMINDNTESDKMYFSDVSAENEYAKIIGACCERGIITQAENFRPDDFVSEYEFSVMVLRALGYDEMPDVDISSPISVKNKANELKLLKNTEFDGTVYVNRENAMWIMYNALNTRVVKWTLDGNVIAQYKEGEYLLEDAFNLILKKGVVTANNETSLTESTENSNNSIAVDNIEYKDESGVLYKNIGERIVFGVDKDDDSVIKFGYSDFEKNNTVTVRCEDLKDVSKTVISYDDNGATRRYRLDEAKILKNHAAFSDYRMELPYFKAADGYLELIDNDGDGAYEIVNIMEPTVIETEKIFFTDGLSIIAKGGEKYYFDGYDNIDLTINGRSASEKSFMNSKIILLYASSDRKNVYADGYSTICTGMVGAKSDDWVEIDNQKYYFSDYFKENLVSGETVTAYYVGDKIFAAEKSTSTAAETIGFVLRTKVIDSEDSLNLRIYTVNGVFIDLKTGDRLTVDGSKWTADKIVSNWDYFNKKFVKFKADNKNTLTWIDTENYIKSNEPDSDMKKVDEVTSSCKKNVDGIWSGFVMAAAVRENAPIFMIPMVNGEYATGSEAEKYYSMSQFSRVYTYNGQPISENSSFYGKDSDGYVTFGVSVKNVPIISGSYAACSSASAPIIVFKNMTETVDDDNEVVGMISGYDISTGSEVSYTMPAGMEYAVDTPAIVSNKVSGLYNTSSNMVLRDVTVPNEYLYPISGLKAGCILRTEVSGKLITGLDLMSNGDWSSELTYTCLNGLDTIYSGYLVMNITMEKMSDGNLIYNTGYGSAVKSYGEFQTMIVIDGKNVSRVNVSELPQYFESGKNAFVLFKNGKAIGIAVNK